MTRIAIGLAFVFASAAVADVGAPGWDAARVAIAEQFRSDEARGDRVVSISENARPELYPAYVRYYAEVLLERTDKTREKHKVWVDFVLVNQRWEVEAYGGIEFKALADVKPPSTAEVERLLKEAWGSCEGFDLQRVKLNGEPEFQREPGADRTKARRGYVFSVEIAAVGTGEARLSQKGAEYRADTRSILWLDAATHTWSVDRRVIRCGFQKTKDAPATDDKPTSISGTEAAAPASADVEKAFQLAWSKVRPDFDVEGVSLQRSGDLHRSGQKEWATYNLTLEVVGTSQGSREWAGKRLLCTPQDFSSVLKWNAVDNTWTVDEKAVKDVNARGVCQPRP